MRVHIRIRTHNIVSICSAIRSTFLHLFALLLFYGSMGGKNFVGWGKFKRELKKKKNFKIILLYALFKLLIFFCKGCKLTVKTFNKELQKKIIKVHMRNKVKKIFNDLIYLKNPL